MNMLSASEARKETIAVLKDYLRGNIAPKDLISKFPDYVEDELLDNIVNVFCEPLSDNEGISSWEDVAEISIRAIEQSWSPDNFENALQKGLPRQMD
jgi:hypothetical protein